MAHSSARIARARHLGETGRAREIRVAAGVSLSEMAADVGVTDASIAGWERVPPRFLPRGENAVRYALILDRLAAEMKQEVRR